MKECITHHHACDCREAEFAGWKARAEKAEAAIGKSWYFEMVKAEARAERAEALLREAPVAHSDHCGATEGFICICRLSDWRAKVRDLLEGKT